MAPSLKQTIANRLNALKSSGPRTPDGRARSARNAVKHGLSRLGATMPDGMAGRIAERQDDWREAYRPEGEAQRWTFERLCAESVRLDLCEHRLLAARAELAERAAESWDDDRAAEVAALAGKLAARPEVIQPRLLQSRHGVLWLLDRWDEVADGVARCDGWTPSNWDRAMDCLGVSAEARFGSGPLDLDPDDIGAGPGLELARAGAEALRDRLSSYLDDRDARARADAEQGLGPDPAEIRLLERYAADARRQVERCRAELRRLQQSAPKHPAPDPRAGTTPPPRPRRTPAPPSAPPNIPADPVPAPEPVTVNAPEAPAAVTGSSLPGNSLSATFAARPGSPPTFANRRERRARAARARRS